MSGGVDVGEAPIEALKREMYEELFVRANDILFKFVGVEHIPEKNMDFYYYEGFCQNEFKPILDHENLNWSWANPNHLPSPLYKGLKEKIIDISLLFKLKDNSYFKASNSFCDLYSYFDAFPEDWIFIPL